jgi:TetR/AcrR family transcriptional repressor of lmrAB and yxaGH operons
VAVRNGESTASGKMDGVPESVRDAMVEAAWLLIAERGLEGMSTREVLARTGAPRGSVYHYFPRGRTELIEQAIEHSRLWMDKQIAAIDARTRGDVVAGYLDIWRRILEATDFRAGCAVTGVITGAQNDDLLDRAARAYKAAGIAVAAQLRTVGVLDDDADRQAQLLVIAAEGAVLIARAQRSIDPLRLVAEQFGTGTRTANPADAPQRARESPG